MARMNSPFFRYRGLIIIGSVLITAMICFSSLNWSSRDSVWGQQEGIPTGTSLPITFLFETQTPISVLESTSTTQPANTPISPASGWATLPPVPVEYRTLIAHGNQTENKVALTFDLCQRENDLAGFDEGIVRILNETQTPATFFVGGLWMQYHEAETLALSNNPLFELGNHSWSHLDFSVISSDQMRSEIFLTQEYMYKLTGRQPQLFRFPYGTYTEEALFEVGEQGLYAIQWDVVSGDPDPNIDADSMTEWVLQQVQPGSIIIMHANGRGWHTAEALPVILQRLNERGYIPVTVSELIKK
jgi:peptidoglycan-N-acetylglucosamine deacetylase